MLMGTLAELDAAATELGEGRGPLPHDPEAAEVLALVHASELTEAAQARAKRGSGQVPAQGPTPEAERALAARTRRVERDEGHGERHKGSSDGADTGDGAEEAAGEAAELRWQRAARDMRFLLQHLIAGGIGLTLASDPELTFRRLFDGLPAWPPRVPPGRRPSGEDDYNAFLAWIFSPDEPDVALDGPGAMPPPPGG